MDQRVFVAEYLTRVFAPQQVPAVELTKENVDVLFALAQRNVLMDVIATEERNDNRIRAEEHAAEAERLHGVLENSVPLEALSSTGKTCARTLGQAVVALRVNSTQQLFAGILALQERREALEGERERLAQLRASLRSDAVQEEKRALTAALETTRKEHGAKAAEAAKQKQQLLYYEKKRAEYAASLAACEAHLQQVGYEPALRHTELVAQFEALQATERECAPLAAELARFGNLEPHVERAQARLDAAKASLAKLKAQYNQELAKLATVADK